MVGGLLLNGYTGIWWPWALFVTLMLLFVPGVVLYVARSRRQSIRSVVAPLVPGHVRYRKRIRIVVVLGAAIGSLTAGLVSSRGPWGGAANGLLLAVLGGIAVSKLVGPARLEQSEDDPDLVWVLVTGIVIYDGVAGLLDWRMMSTWTTASWSLPVGVLMLIAGLADWLRNLRTTVPAQQVQRSSAKPSP